MPNAKYVRTGAPAPTGLLWYAPPGTALPTDASTALSDAFKDIGYVTEDGYTKPATSSEPETTKADGGDDVIVTPATPAATTFTVDLLEVDNPDVAKLAFGNSNVVLDTHGDIQEIHVKNSYQGQDGVFVFETIGKEDDQGNRRKIREVIGSGTIVKTGDETVNYTTAVTYPMTITAVADADGDSYKRFYSPMTH